MGHFGFYEEDTKYSCITDRISHGANIEFVKKILILKRKSHTPNNWEVYKGEKWFSIIVVTENPKTSEKTFNEL